MSVLIQFFLFSTCFEHLVFITRKMYSTCSLIWRVFNAFMQAVHQVQGCARY